MDNTFKKQSVLRDFVHNHVYYNQTMLIDHLMKTDDSILDDIENLILPCGDCDNCNEGNSEECEDNMQEIYEWWLVSEWLYNMLKKESQPVLNIFGCYYWGRTCTGQAIYMDYLIEKIYNKQ